MPPAIESRQLRRVEPPLPRLMLLSFWFLALLVAGALVALGCSVAVFARRRHRPSHWSGWRSTAVSGAAACLGLSLAFGAVLDGINRKFSYIPSFAALFGNISPDLTTHAMSSMAAAGPVARTSRPPAQGVVEKLEVGGPVSGVAPRDTYVYLPPAYFDGSQPNRRFPVVYLLHGSPGESVDWLRGGYLDRTMDELLAKQAIQPFIVVMPDFNGGFARDTECENIVGGPQIQTYLATDVVAFIDARYRTLANPGGRAIGGLSTGGYCGINLAFRHQDVFSAAISHSGYGRPDQNRYTGDLFGGQKELERANTPDDYIPTIAITRPMAVYLDAGEKDTDSRLASTSLYDKLKARGVDVTLNIVKGEAHDFVAFRRDIRLSLPWVSKWFAGQPDNSARELVAGPDTSDLPPPAPGQTATAPRQACQAPITRRRWRTTRRLVVSHQSTRPPCRA